MRIVVAICAAIAFTATTSGVAFCGKATINTYKRWQGSTVSPFGCPFTTTYGQVITVPANAHTLNKFRFWWSGGGSIGSMVVRGEIYAWNGSKATGEALYESRRKTISYSDTDFHPVTFKPATLPVNPGAQYVLFASIDKEYEQCTGYQIAWASVDDSVYPAGTFVFQNSNGDEGQWTTEPWNTANIDTAFKVYLSP
jgi:hypothetical protein